ncbi:MAG: hypothetical protein CL845_06720 [Crocinitomicaceae bacterium]|nr:hypothetical protein [Crocinitomicaceae bacterium]|tara:strand:+ start:783 stop:1190 length:408 start_codon:yes stop_codon:yes gene_type:complete
MKDVNIRHFKLTSGEELIGLVQHSDDHAFVIERPVTVKLNSIGMWMYSPWFPFSEKKIFKLFKRHVINHVEIDDESKKHYINYSVNKKENAERTPSFNEVLDKILKEQNIDPLHDDDLIDEYDLYQNTSKEPTIH